MMAAKEHWKSKPDDHDYPAALNYLALVATELVAAHIVEQLKGASLSHFKAKDLLRASQLPLLPEDDPAVARDLKKVKKGEQLSPVLLVRGNLAGSIALTVADGYHRICASYHLTEDADIPCRIADHEG
jgi:hypothetical protein